MKMEVAALKSQPAPRKSSGPPTARLDNETAATERRITEAHNAYGRGKKIQTKRVKDKKLRGNLRTLEAKYKDATVKAKDAEILLENEGGFLEPEGELERSYKVRQDEIRQDVAVQVAALGKCNLKLDATLGPYFAEYTRNGRDLLLAGRKSMVATMDWRDGKLGCELQLAETIRDVKWLNNNQRFAVAQKKHVFIYDHQGVEIHKLTQHIEVTNMEVSVDAQRLDIEDVRDRSLGGLTSSQYLPYHYLLATAGNAGHLKYTDISTGQMVIDIATHLGTPTATFQNPANAIIHMGHQRGLVTLWSPNQTEPLAKLKMPYSAPVRSLAINRSGHYMIATGDSQMSVWDNRFPRFKPMHNYFLRRPGKSVAISDRDLTAVGWGTQLSIWKGLFNKASEDQAVKVQSPYMAWGGDGQAIERVRWCPFEDVLGVSHDQGFSTLIAPGAGEPNFDALETNPYENTKQRQEAEVKGLLNKLQPEMISLDPNFIGTVDLASAETRKREQDLDRKADDPVARLKNRGRGKNSALRKYLRKKGGKNIIDENRLRVEAARKMQNKRESEKAKKQAEEYGPALARFARKGA